MEGCVFVRKMRLHPNLEEAARGMTFAFIRLLGVEVTPAGREQTVQLARICGEIRERTRLDDISGIPGVDRARTLFRRLGTDPARYRPAQESLLRRIVQGKELSSINSAVDAVNFLSLKYRFSMGIYDLGVIEGDLTLKAGEEGETYTALNGREINAAGKPVLCDQAGPIGSPYVDSRRTAVGEQSRDLLHVVYCVPEQTEDSIYPDMETFFKTLFPSARVTSCQTIPQN